LLDTGDAETPLDILTPFMSDRDRGFKQRALAKRAAGGWIWDMETLQEPPPLPAAVRPGVPADASHGAAAGP
jgi:hypothetical protein